MKVLERLDMMKTVRYIDMNTHIKDGSGQLTPLGALIFYLKSNTTTIDQITLE